MNELNFLNTPTAILVQGTDLSNIPSPISGSLNAKKLSIINPSQILRADVALEVLKQHGVQIMATTIQPQVLFGAYGEGPIAKGIQSQIPRWVTLQGIEHLQGLDETIHEFGVIYEGHQFMVGENSYVRCALLFVRPRITKVVDVEAPTTQPVGVISKMGLTPLTSGDKVVFKSDVHLGVTVEKDGALVGGLPTLIESNKELVQSVNDGSITKGIVTNKRFSTSDFANSSTTFPESMIKDFLEVVLDETSQTDEGVEVTADKLFWHGNGSWQKCQAIAEHLHREFARHHSPATMLDSMMDAILYNHSMIGVDVSCDNMFFCEREEDVINLYTMLTSSTYKKDSTMPNPMLHLKGEPGTGKDVALEMVGYILNQVTCRITCFSTATMEFLCGQYGFANNQTSYTPSPFLSGLVHGGLVILDEVNAISPGELQGINGCDDGTKAIVAASTKWVIHPRARLATTRNPGGMAGTSESPESFLGRGLSFDFGKADGILKNIVGKGYSAEAVDLACRYGSAIDAMVESGSIELEAPFGRKVAHILNLYTNSGEVLDLHMLLRNVCLSVTADEDSKKYASKQLDDFFGKPQFGSNN